MNLNITEAKLLLIEEAKKLPKEILAVGVPYWIRPNTVGTTCPYIDEMGELQQGSIFDDSWIRPVISTKETVNGKLYEEISYAGAKWYVLSSHRLLAKDVVEEVYRFRFDTSSKNDFEEKDVRDWADYTYKNFTKKDIAPFTDSYFFPEGVAIIDEEIFEGNTKLTEIRLPDSVRNIGNSAFKDCVSLEKVSLGTGLSCGGSGVFLHCRNIREVHVKSIETLFNYGCDNCGSPLQYGADLYVNGIRCTHIDIPRTAKYPWIVYPLIGCGSIKSVSISRQTPCFDELMKLMNDLNNGGESVRYFTDGPIRPWEVTVVQ